MKPTPAKTGTIKTASILLWRGPPRGAARRVPTIDHAQLMQASYSRLEAAAHSDLPEYMLIAERLLSSPKAFSIWENGHAYLMRHVARQSNRARQTLALLSVAVALIHRKALFEHLRDGHVRGSGRHKLMTLLHGYGDYAGVMVHEHENFLRSAASYLCTRHVGLTCVSTLIFDEPLLSYEQLYTDYFRRFCDVAVAPEGDAGAAAASELLAYQKHQLKIWRDALLALPASASVWRPPTLEFPLSLLAS